MATIKPIFPGEQTVYLLPLVNVYNRHTRIDRQAKQTVVDRQKDRPRGLTHAGLAKIFIVF